MPCSLFQASDMNITCSFIWAVLYSICILDAFYSATWFENFRTLSIKNSKISIAVSENYLNKFKDDIILTRKADDFWEVLFQVFYFRDCRVLHFFRDLRFSLLHSALNVWKYSILILYVIHMRGKHFVDKFKVLIKLSLFFIFAVPYLFFIWATSNTYIIVSIINHVTWSVRLLLE